MKMLNNSWLSLEYVMIFSYYFQQSNSYEEKFTFDQQIIHQQFFDFKSKAYAMYLNLFSIYRF